MSPHYVIQVRGLARSSRCLACRGDGTVFIDIVIFALIAAFLVYRLRAVLGRRHGDERPRVNPYSPTPQAPGHADQDNVITLPERTWPAPGDAPAQSSAPVDAGLAQIGVADPSFDRQHFVRGATSAFSMIVAAFAEGDTATLRPLLGDEIYGTFERDIRQRQAAGETLKTEIESLRADIADARLEGRMAYVTIRFTSAQSHVLRNAGGEPVDSESDRMNEVVDLWTFSRDTRSSDPNWLLVETRTP